MQCLDAVKPLVKSAKRSLATHCSKLRRFIVNTQLVSFLFSAITRENAALFPIFVALKIVRDLLENVRNEH